MTEAEPVGGLDTVIITGLSGAGRSTAAKCFEDLGFFVVDNLPPELIGTLVELGSRSQDAVTRLAVVMDVRSRAFSKDLRGVIRELADRRMRPRVLFLEARDDVLVRRFENVRREHPMQGEGRLVDGIAAERALLAPLREQGFAFDTSDLSAAALRGWIKDFIAVDPSKLTLLFESFGFKHGVPLDADLVFDARCLPNPHYEQELAPLTGKEDAVIDFLVKHPEVERMYGDIYHFVASWLPDYARDNRNYLTVAIGCTGGRHRSVYLVERLAKVFGQRYQVLVRHRELE